MAALVAAFATSLVPAAPASADVLLKEIVNNNPGPLGAVTVLGDSVLLGSGLTSPTLPDQLAAAGWGPIRFRASVGMFAGPPTRDTSAARWIQTWRTYGWDAPNIIVNLGANDAGICQNDAACARRRILDVVDAIGPGHRIWWPMVTAYRSGAHGWAETWNRALEQIAAERLDVFTWNWPHEMATGGYASSDNIHLTGDGYRRRSARMAEVFTSTVAQATRIGGDATLPSPASSPTRFVPLDPVRVMDTRLESPWRRPSGTEFPVALAAHVPIGTTAVAVNVTAAGPSEPGYLSVAPCGGATGASTVNFTPGGTRAAMTLVPLDALGRVCVSNHGATDVIVDLQGAFVTGGAGSGLVPLSSNQRILDTRATGRARHLVIPTGAGVQAVAVNLTVVGAAESGWLRAAPCGASTGVSNVNFGPGEAIAGAAFVATASDATICVDITADADVIVDLTATFGAGGLAFVPSRPTRMLDTRNAIGGWSPIQGAGQTLDVGVAPAAAEAVTGTLTIVEPATNGGFLVGHRCGALPPTSSVNADRRGVLANLVTTGISGGRLCVFSHTVSHSLFDVTGWWVR